MALTRAQLREQVQLNTGREDKAELVNSALNFAQVEIARRHDFSVLQTETTRDIEKDQLSLDLPSRCLRLTEVRLMDGLLSWELYVQPKAIIVKQIPNISVLQSMKPRWCYTETNMLFLAPKPEKTYTVTMSFVQYPQDLTVDDATSPLEMDDALIAFATRKVFMSVQQYQDAAFWESEFEKRLTVAIRSDITKPAQLIVAAGVHSHTRISNAPYLDPFAGMPGRSNNGT